MATKFYTKQYAGLLAKITEKNLIFYVRLEESCRRRML